MLLRLFTIIINAALLLSLFPWPLFLFASIFLLDSPTSTSNPLIWSTAWSTWLYPVFVLLGSMKAYKYTGERNYATALKWLVTMKCGESIITRWHQILAGYDFEVKHVPGRANVVAEKTLI